MNMHSSVLINYRDILFSMCGMLSYIQSDKVCSIKFRDFKEYFLNNVLQLVILHYISPKVAPGKDIHWDYIRLVQK